MSSPLDAHVEIGNIDSRYILVLKLLLLQGNKIHPGVECGGVLVECGGGIVETDTLDLGCFAKVQSYYQRYKQ